MLKYDTSMDFFLIFELINKWTFYNKNMDKKNVALDPFTLFLG